MEFLEVVKDALGIDKKDHIGIVYLPASALNPMDKAYPIKKDEPVIHLPLVAIYNTRQLAKEIAQELAKVLKKGGVIS